MRQELGKIEEAINEPSLWENPTAAGELLKKKESFQRQVDAYEKTKSRYEELSELLALADAEGDDAFVSTLVDDIKALTLVARKQRIEAFFTRPEDSHHCFLEVQAGAGGTEAQDWAEMLLRMYVRWAQQRGYAVEFLAESKGEEAGVKSAAIRISGPSGGFPYGWLKRESGVHRLVRISPFDASARRHTSFASVWVSPEMDETVDLQIREADLRVDTYRSSGAGGQHVNKTDSAIRITHLPTGIVVQCQQDRSQHRNRSIAMSMLKARLFDMREKEREKEAESLNEAEKSGITWGHQIRSYVLQPYQMVKDLRTQVESPNPSAVLDGDIDLFLEASLTEFCGSSS